LPTDVEYSESGMVFDFFKHLVIAHIVQAPGGLSCAVGPDAIDSFSNMKGRISNHWRARCDA